MMSQFFELAGRLERELRRGELLLCNFSGERSDFVRFNRGRVRQAGSVEQRSVSLRLVRERRQAAASLPLGGAGDSEQAIAALGTLRDALERLPEDPWLLVNESPQSSEDVRRGVLGPAEAVVDEIVTRANGVDLVGIYAAGAISRGFASSLGQRNWHEVDSFNFDWSLYRSRDQAVKSGYAGLEWNPQVLGEKLEAAGRELSLLGQPAQAIEPGEYRAYLAPRALEEIAGMLSWGGFSARMRATRQSPLLRMQEGARVSERVTLAENTAEGIAPAFQADGFPRPPGVILISQGALADALVSPRSAREFSLAPNGANGAESPESLELAPGTLAAADALGALDDGLYISNLWYLNYSDRPAGRITGMTRFATFRVKGGRIVAPVRPMRFDDTVYRILGENLYALTRERELLLDASTYGGRSTSSSRLPGALLGALRFTL